MREPGPVRCSVIVPVLNAATTLSRQLDALVAQTSPVPFEVIVADNGSTDGSTEIARRYGSPVRVVDASHARGINVARNTGIRAAQGDLLLFCDADDEVRPGWLAAYWTAFAEGGTLFGGPLRRVTAEGVELRWQLVLNDDLHFLPWPTGANCGFARSVLLDVDLFDETLRGGGDETDLFWRAQLRGHDLRLVAGSGIDYVARPDLPGVLKQFSAFGRSHVRLYATFRDSGMPRPRPRDTARRWWRMLLDVLRSRASRDSVTRVARNGALLWGHVQGSLQHRVLYV